MKRYKLIINPFAELDLQTTKEWYDLQREGLSDELITEIDKTLNRIKENPLQFRYIKKKIRMAIINRFPFGIFYYVKGEVINVFAIFHFSRNPKIWKKRI